MLQSDSVQAVSLAGVLTTGAASADHVGGDTWPVFVFTLTVRHRVQADLHQDVGRTPTRAQRPPARGDGLHIVVVVGGGQTHCRDATAEGDWAAQPQDGEVVVNPLPVVAWMQGGAAHSDLLLTVRLGEVMLPQHHPAYGKPSILKR